MNLTSNYTKAEMIINFFILFLIIVSGILYFFLRRIMASVILKTSITPLLHNSSKL